MKFVRNLAGYKLIDQKRNTDIQAELNRYHLRKKQNTESETGMNIS
jgi:hypothetical protein